MADINSNPRPGTASPALVEVARIDADVPAKSLVEIVELLFFAYRDFTSEPDEILHEMGFGRAHHRVLHFVNRNPGLRVADLLNVLRITKQSLARVLKQLVDEGYINQERPIADRRERRLHLTPKGAALAERLLRIQTERIETALARTPDGDGNAARKFLMAMIGEADRDEVEAMLSGRTQAYEKSEASAK